MIALSIPLEPSTGQLTWPILTLSIVLILTSIVLALFILLHKSRGGMSDLFGGGMSTGMGGTSVAERNLDRLTVIIGVIWVASVIGLLVLYRFFGSFGALS